MIVRRASIGLQRRLRSGRSRTHDPSLNHSRPRGFCFYGNFSPSRRQIRSTRSLPTCQPSRFSNAVIRR